MTQESSQPNASLLAAGAAAASSSADDAIGRIAARLYNLASMLVGEGEQSIQLVETAVVNADASMCHEPALARKAGLRALSAAALHLLAQRDSSSLAAPVGFEPAATCIEDDDISSAGISSEELEGMIGGPDRDRVRRWLASLSTPLRTVFVLRAVAGFSTAETTALLQEYGGARAAGWTPEAVREFFRQALCSLASQLIHASAAR